MSSDYSPRLMGGVTTGITADTGSAQGDGLLSAGVNVISTCANAGDAVSLPTGVGQNNRVTVVNTGAESADVFPPTGGTINGASANAAKATAAGVGYEFIQIGTDGLTWIAI